MTWMVYFVHFNNVVVAYPTDSKTFGWNAFVYIQLIHTARHEWVNDTRVLNFFSSFFVLFFAFGEKDREESRKTPFISICVWKFTHVGLNRMGAMNWDTTFSNNSPHEIITNINQINVCTVHKVISCFQL